MKILSTTNTAPKRRLITYSALALSQALFCLSTQAGILVDTSNAVAGPSDGYKNTPNHIIGKKDGYFGANIYTDSAENTDISVEFLGSQAKWDIWFTLSNGNDAWTVVNHPNNASGIVKANNSNRQQGTVSAGANQLLNFSFNIDVLWNGIGADYIVKNGNNTLPTSLQPNNPTAYFWTGFEYNEQGNISAILLGLDDGGGWPTTDEDNDDLMIRMTGFNNAIIKPTSTPEVPVPASFGLFATALGLTSLARRKKS